jgi:hypothetical protein
VVDRCGSRTCASRVRRGWRGGVGGSRGAGAGVAGRQVHHETPRRRRALLLSARRVVCHRDPSLGRVGNRPAKLASIGFMRRCVAKPESAATASGIWLAEAVFEQTHFDA